MTSAYRYCASSSRRAAEAGERRASRRAACRGRRASATAAIRPSVRSSRSARSCSSSSQPSASSTSAASSSLAAQVGGRDLVELAGEPEARERRERGQRPPDEHHVELPRAVEAQLVELGRASPDLERVDAVAHEHGLGSSTPSQCTEAMRSSVGRSAPRDPGSRRAPAAGTGRTSSSRSSSDEPDTTGLAIARAHCATPVVLPLPAGPVTRVTRASSDAVEPRRQLPTTHLVARRSGDVVRAWHRPYHPSCPHHPPESVRPNHPAG